MNLGTSIEFGEMVSCSSEESDCYEHLNSSSGDLGSVEENNEDSDELLAEKQDVIRRVPRGFSSRLGYWKAEEYVNFAFPASELIFDGLLGPTDYHIWQLIVRMSELVFRQREGWEYSDALFGRMATRFIILLEENYGIESCLVTTNNLQHVAEDAFRFSHPDNYWCFSFERAVKRYVRHTSNFKNPECSFAKRESLREMLKTLQPALKLLPDVGKFKFNLDKVKIH